MNRRSGEDPAVDPGYQWQIRVDERRPAAEDVERLLKRQQDGFQARRGRAARFQGRPTPSLPRFVVGSARRESSSTPFPAGQRTQQPHYLSCSRRRSGKSRPVPRAARRCRFRSRTVRLACPLSDPRSRYTSHNSLRRHRHHFHYTQPP